MPFLQCPRCAARLTVSDWAPPVLTCPDCLARLSNPGGARAGAQLPPPMPLRVIPVEQQVDRDARLAGFTLFALAAVLAGAAWLTLMVPFLRKIGIGIAVVFVLVLVTAILQLRYPHSVEVQHASEAMQSLAWTVLKIVLIIFGLVLLLLGTCAVILGGIGALS